MVIYEEEEEDEEEIKQDEATEAFGE